MRRDIPAFLADETSQRQKDQAVEHPGACWWFGSLTLVAGSVKPNDLISLSGPMSRSATRVTFSDRSTAITKSVTGKGTLPHTDPSPLVQCTEPPITGVLLGVPKFTTLTFTNVQVNGANIGTYTAAPGSTSSSEPGERVSATEWNGPDSPAWRGRSIVLTSLEAQRGETLPVVASSLHVPFVVHGKDSAWMAIREDGPHDPAIG